MRGALADLATGRAPVAEDAPATVNAAQIRKSVQRDRLISFIDGKSYKTLKRHLTAHGLTPASYRERFGLPADYPMVAAAYSERRSSLAKAHGLGSPQDRDDRWPPDAEALQRPRRSAEAVASEYAALRTIDGAIGRPFAGRPKVCAQLSRMTSQDGGVVTGSAAGALRARLRPDAPIQRTIRSAGSTPRVSPARARPIGFVAPMRRLRAICLLDPCEDRREPAPSVAGGDSNALAAGLD